ncbi:tyrosine-protein kinase RYK-like protein [Dinothrombium tinctorium]|uniref:receptor protein-tyrosine kinase n=1 Tax=Dinothrombium tinctorium TaxID=1965070 RepID=A0A3S3P0H4_9ACAR|nr:tyrosine-protein kinase RYK-like protein [Dinothrombium tinctorium]
MINSSFFTKPQMPYSIALSVNDISAIGTPTINITRKGNVPTKEQGRDKERANYSLSELDAEVDVNIYVNITMSPNSNVTQLTLKRKKICRQGQPQRKSLEEESVLADASAMVASSNPFYIMIGFASCAILLVSLAALFCYYRSQKGHNPDVTNSYAGVTSHLSSSKAGQSFLRVDTPNHSSTISKTGSQYWSFRRLATPSSLQGTLIMPVHNNTSSISDLHHASRLSDQIMELSVERRRILLREKMQEGTFAQVYSGILIEDRNNETNSSSSEVMVKTVSDQASKMQVSLFLIEGMSMYTLQHRHVLNVIAACIDDPQRPLLVYPLMNKGNLKLFLQKCKFSPEGQVHTLLTQDLVSIALQIIQGMIYLHRRKIIHKDLATRNCVVSANDDGTLLVKITDNALSRDLFPNDYHCLGDNENRPVKWLAIESLLKKEFHQASDVWAFGVTFWELMTLGQQPYFEVDPFEMGAYLRDGYRLFQPINCPDNLYDIMVCCWNAVPEERPTFPQLLTFLSEFYTALGKYI